MLSIFVQLHKRLENWPDTYLSVALFIAAFVIFCIALIKDRPLLKAIALAYIVFP